MDPPQLPQKVPPVPENQLYRWCFTVNNPQLPKEDWMAHLQDHCKFIIIGDEVGEEGTPHLQGYFELKKKQRFRQVKSLLNDLDESNPHIEGCKGSRKNNVAYCSKEGNSITFGDNNKQGHRTDLDIIAQGLSAGKSQKEVALESPATWIRNYRGIAAYERLIQPEPRRYRENFEVHLYIGTTGAGKTYKAMHKYPKIYKKPIGKSLWFDNIPIGCKQILIDECVGQFPLDQMLQIMDKYVLQVEVKGSHAFADVDLLILTTNTHPHTWYKNFEGRAEQALAFCRRLTRVYLFNGRDDVTKMKDREEISEWWENFTPVNYDDLNK